MTSSAPALAPRITGLLRVRRVAGTVFLLCVPLDVILLFAGILFQQAMLFRGALMVLIISMFAHAIDEVCRAWLLWTLGAWMGLDGQSHSRAERPGRFMNLLAVVVKTEKL